MAMPKDGSMARAGPCISCRVILILHRKRNEGVPDLMRWFDLSRISCFSSKFEFFCLNDSFDPFVLTSVLHQTWSNLGQDHSNIAGRGRWRRRTLKGGVLVAGSGRNQVWDRWTDSTILSKPALSRYCERIGR